MKARRTNLDIWVAKARRDTGRDFRVGYDAAGLYKGSVRWKYCLLEGNRQLTKWKGSKAAVLEDIRAELARIARAA